LFAKRFQNRLITDTAAGRVEKSVVPTRKRDKRPMVSRFIDVLHMFIKRLQINKAAMLKKLNIKGKGKCAICKDKGKNQG